MIESLANIVVLATEAGGAAEEEGGSFLVTPDIGLMLWTLLVFGLTMFLLAKLAFPRIGEALDRRQRAIEESIDTAERTRVEADKLLAEYRERLTEARHQADEIVARARRAGEQQEADAVAKGRERREELLAQARRDIEAETRRAIQEIRAEVADLTVMATEKVTRKTLTGDDQGKLDEVREQLGQFADAVDGDRGLQVFFFSPYFSTQEKVDGLRQAIDGAEPIFLNFLELLLENHRMPAIFRIRREYDRLWKDRNRLLPVQVTSAVELDEQTVRNIGDRIAEQTGRRVELSSSVEPDILGGIVVRVGNQVLDASIRNRLETLRKQVARG